MNQQIDILVVGECPIIRWAIKELLRRVDDSAIVGEASSIAEAVKTAELHQPRVIISELILPDGNIIQSLPQLNNKGRSCVLAFCDKDDWQNAKTFLKAGGQGIISKTSILENLQTAVQTIINGQQWISPLFPLTDTKCNSCSDLSIREREVAVLVAKGLTSKQMAEQLCISVRTVENHRHRIFSKLNINHCTQLADYAYKHGLI